MCHSAGSARMMPCSCYLSAAQAGSHSWHDRALFLEPPHFFVLRIGCQTHHSRPIKPSRPRSGTALQVEILASTQQNASCIRNVPPPPPPPHLGCFACTSFCYQNQDLMLLNSSQQLLPATIKKMQVAGDSSVTNAGVACTGPAAMTSLAGRV